jgi:hypothetical protein
MMRHTWAGIALATLCAVKGSGLDTPPEGPPVEAVRDAGYRLYNIRAGKWAWNR